MPKHTSKKRGSATPAKAAALGIAVSLGTILLLAALGALLISRGTIPEGGAWVIAALAVFLAALLGPLPLVHATGKRGLGAAYLQMGLLLAVLAVAKLIFWPGVPYGSWASLAAAPTGATLCGLLQLRRGRRRR